MDPAGETAVDHQRLIEIANATVYGMVSTSARTNLTEQIASGTVEEYLEAIASGEEIHNPYAWVQIRARWRTIDAMRKWQRRKLRTRAIDDPNTQFYMENLGAELGRAIAEAGDDPARVVEAAEWVRELIETTFPDDSTNRRLAIACLVEGAKPREVADEFDMDAKVISNRLGRIRTKLIDELPA